MSVEIRSAMGWTKVLVLANEMVELMITLDVGPRIISYRHHGGINVLKTFEDQIGASGEPNWRIRGGHRLWIAPESKSTYFPDNQQVSFDVINDHRVRFRPPTESANGLSKELELALEVKGPGVQVNHSVLAVTPQLSAIAPWGLTVLRPGGKAIVPMPAGIAHPNEQKPGTGTDADWLPNRSLSLWPYTDMNDDRFKWYADRFELTQDANLPSTKVGFLHKMQSAHYEVQGYRFSKTIHYKENSCYPDGSCNLEIFTNETMLELESLGPLTTMKQGETITHIENWSLNLM